MQGKYVFVVTFCLVGQPSLHSFLEYTYMLNVLIKGKQQHGHYIKKLDLNVYSFLITKQKYRDI